MLLVQTIYNIVQYVIRQKKYKEFHIAFFYSLAVLVISMRVVQFVLETFVFQIDNDGEKPRFEEFLILFPSIMVGLLSVQQLSTMVELYVNLLFIRNTKNSEPDDPVYKT